MTKNQVEALGERVLRKLGPGWHYTIWLNIDWSVHWVNGAVSLYFSLGTDGKMSFWGMVGRAGLSATGHSELTPRFPIHRRNPVAAVRAICEFAKEKIQEQWSPIEKSVDDVLSSCKKGRAKR